MKLGIIAASHDREGIKRIKDLGLSHAELDINADDISYVDPESIKEALEEFDVSVGAVGRWGRDRILADGSFNSKELKDEQKLIDICELWGCPVYVAGINYRPELSYYANITAAIKYLEELLAYADGRVKISTYNCSWNNYIDKQREWDIVHSHLPNLGIKFDPSHTINGGRDYMWEASEYGTRFYHIHLKGTINIRGKRIDDPPAGLDMINWPGLMSLFRFHKYEGMLSIEPHSSIWQGELGDKGVRYTIEYFKKLLFSEY